METTKHPINKERNAEMKNLKFGLELELVRISKADAARAVQTVVGGSVESLSNGSYQVIALDGRT